MTSNPNDPSGLVTNPPQTIVKIQGTARDDINGLLGIVVQYNADRGRYLVHLTSNQTVVAMKPENLIKANYLEQFQAQYQQLSKDPQIQNFLNQIKNKLPPGVTLDKLGIGLGVFLLVLIYLLGFSRTLMLLSFVMMGGMIIGPDLYSGANRQTIIRNAPMRFQTIVREQFPGGSYIADKPYALAGLAVLMTLFFVKSMMPVGTTAKPATPPPLDHHQQQPTRQLLAQSSLEEFYKLGYDDAKAEKEFGHSLADALKKSPANLGGGGGSSDGGVDVNILDEVDLGVPDYPMPPLKTGGSAGGGGGVLNKLFSLSSAMSIMYLGRTAMELGKDANGSWQFDLFKANLTTLEPWKLGLLGFSLYRLVSTILGG